MLISIQIIQGSKILRSDGLVDVSVLSMFSLDSARSASHACRWCMATTDTLQHPTDVMNFLSFVSCWFLDYHVPCDQWLVWRLNHGHTRVIKYSNWWFFFAYPHLRKMRNTGPGFIQFASDVCFLCDWLVWMIGAWTETLHTLITDCFFAIL